MPNSKEPEPTSTVPGRILPLNLDGVLGRVSGWFDPRGASHIEIQIPTSELVQMTIDGDQFTFQLPEAVASDVAEALIAVAGQLSAARAALMHAEAKSN
jgi:hypothetical protein